MKLDDIDLALMRLTQAGLPLVPQPYHFLAQELDISANEVITRFQAMLSAGIIRRIGVVPNHYKLGYRFNGMTVWNVPDEVIDQVGQLVGQLPFVSHCYQRPRNPPQWQYNLFAMVHGKTQAEVQRQIQHIAEILGEHNIASDVLFSHQILKKTGFRSG